MKNYTLSKDLFNQTDELFASIDLLEKEFPGILATNDFISNGSSGTREQRIKLQVVLAFKDMFGEDDRNSEHINPIQRVYAERLHDQDNLELLLAKYLSVSEEFLKDHNVNVIKAVEYGFLVANSFIQLSAEEINHIIKCMNNTTVSALEELRNSIFNKLRGNE